MENTKRYVNRVSWRSEIRSEVEKVLLMEIGLSLEETSELMGYDPITIRNDTSSFVGMDGFAKDRPDPQDRFAKAFACFAECECYKRPDPEKKIRWVLEKWLGLKEFVAAAEMTLRVLAKPKLTAAQEPYYPLVEAIFGKNSVNPGRAWQELLSDVAIGANPAPRSLTEAKETIARLMANAVRNGVAPTWPDDAVERINEALSTLDLAEQSILRLRFGPNRDGKTRKERGASLNTTLNVVQQCELLALRKLRRQPVSERLRCLAYPLSNLEDLKIEQKQAADESMALKEVDENGFLKILFKRVDELDLSVRSANNLQKAEIDFIWQLVEKTDAELMKMKNFGRNSLYEIKALLSERRLNTGMTLPADFPRGIPAKQ